MIRLTRNIILIRNIRNIRKLIIFEDPFFRIYRRPPLLPTPSTLIQLAGCGWLAG